jgi:SAM-dependent methyltransferase
VLDLGCGIGKLAPALVNCGFDYTGVDISPTAIDLAKQREPRGRFEVANIARLPFTKPFDIILERTVFIHLVEDDYWNAVISEVGRLLAPRGTFLFMDHLPRDAESVPGHAPHVKFRLYDEYAIALGRVGLDFNEHARKGIAAKIDLRPHTHLVTHKV